MGRIFEGIPVRFWLAIILFFVLVLAIFSLYQRFALPPKVTISQANFVGKVVVKTNKGELQIRNGIVNIGIVTKTTSINLSNGDHEIVVTQGEKILERVIRHVDKEPIKKIVAEPKNPLFLQVLVYTNDQVAKVFVNKQVATYKNGVFATGFFLWSIQKWEEESLNLRIEDKEGNGGVYPPIPLSTYLPENRIELRDQNNQLWGISSEKPFWWNFLSTFKVQTYIGKELVSTQVITWEQAALLVIEILIQVLGVAGILVGFAFLTQKILRGLINLGRLIELVD